MTYLDKNWRLTVYYTTTPAGLTLLSHIHNVYINITDGVSPGGDWGDYFATIRSGGEVSMTTYLDTYMDLVEPVCPPTTSFIRAELWAADPGSDDFIFYSVVPIGHVGSGAAGGGYNSQIMTFRCQDGKGMRLQFAETSVSAGDKDPYPFANAASAALAAHASGSSSAIVNKFTFFPIAPVNNCVEQNENYWKDRRR